MLIRKIKSFGVALLTAVLVAACATNPVTGKRELSFVGENWELETGKQAYSPYRQAQGGDYNVDPQVQAYISEVGQRLAKVSDRKLPYEFTVLNSSVPNAWALPGGKIAINRGLLTELNSEAELAAVLGHEIVHAAARHGAKAQTRGLGLQIGVIGAALAGGQGGGQLASVGAQLVNQKYGRGAELESDYYGMVYMSRAGYDPSAAIDLQQTFVRLSEGRKTDWISGLFASHPPSQQRVAKNKETAAELPLAGERGEDEYKRRLHTLFETKPAYDAYDEAVKAFKKEDYAKASQQLKKAKQLESREALFDLLEGDIANQRNNKRAAMNSYEQAARKHPNFFAPLAKRGAMNYERGNISAAKSDLRRAQELLPGYPVTHYTLGRIARDEGNSQEAIKQFQLAARSKSDIGTESYVELLRLDLPRNPQKYVQTRATSNSGEIVVQLVNPTPVALANITVAIRIVDGAGRNRTVERSFRGVLEPKKRATLRTRISSNNVSSAKSQAVAARIAH